MREVSPKGMVLDLLRVTPRERAVPVRALVQIGELFGFNGNAVRVAVTRLVASGLAESDERGSYRLAPRGDAVNRFVDEWRMGGDRTRPWRGDWLAVVPARAGARAERRRNDRALQRLGFVQGLEAMWVRPDNLAPSRDELARRLELLGLATGSELFSASDASPALAARWCAMWPLDRLRATYRKTLDDLARSTARVHSLPKQQALVETFLLGGAAIRVLAVDPLLPDEILPSDDRRALTEAMLAYDELGRSIWTHYVDRARFDGAPSHLSAVRGSHV